MSGSYLVLFVSLAAHSAQFAFLVFFENPRKCRSVLNSLSQTLIRWRQILSAFMASLSSLLNAYPFLNRH